jgi:ribonuclease HI
MFDDNELIIYTDGSSFSSPRTGGAGIRIVTIDDDGDEVVEDVIPCGFEGATNNQMELQAPIIALKEVLKKGFSSHSKIIIRTDSRYVVDNYKRAIFQWSNQKWLNNDGKPILNAKQWKELIKLINKVYLQRRRTVEFEWVKGHYRNIHNKAVDRTAKESAKIRSGERISFVRVRRKKFQNQKSEIGSVKMNGQRILLHIITDEYLSVQKIYRYRYQVISTNSPYYKKIDFAFSKELLNAGHSYYVKLNNDNKNPQIIKIYREIISKEN